MKRIFITGVSSGIGLAIAEALAARGDEVWGTSRNRDRVPQMPRLHSLELDLSSPESIEQAFKQALSEAGYFDVVINNAGNGHFGPAEFLAAKTLTDQFQVLIFGQIQLMQLALQAMNTRGRGLIINVTSLASRLPVPFMAAYNAAKAAFASFTMSIQLELPDSGIRVVDLQPGDICTQFNDAVNKGTGHGPRYEARVATTWEAVDHNMRVAPKPDLVAKHVLKLIDEANPAARVTVGDAFQTKVAPLIFRFLPQRLRLWGLKKYYGI
jgi:short-subunit dehydrogenase